MLPCLCANIVVYTNFVLKPTHTQVLFMIHYFTDDKEVKITISQVLIFLSYQMSAKF